MKTINEHLQANGLMKQWVAEQLGITKYRFSTLVNNPHQIKRDKLKVEELCQIFNCTPDDIDFDNV